MASLLIFSLPVFPLTRVQFTWPHSPKRPRKSTKFSLHPNPRKAKTYNLSGFVYKLSWNFDHNKIAIILNFSHN